jgi:hypothetical protein
MGSNLKVKIKATGKKAQQLLQAANSMPDASGANYVSRNDLHLDPGTKSGTNRASQRVPYKARPGIQGKSTATPELVGNERAQVNKPETGAKVALKPEGFGPSYVGEDFDCVKPVERELNLAERARQKNNRTRDMRTNLGRGKPSQPTTDAGGQTPTR